MLVPIAILVATLLGGVLTFNAYRPLVRDGPLSLWSFIAGWLISELPVHHVLWQLLVTAGFLWLGALRAWEGWVALGLDAVSWVALGYLVVEANRAHDLLGQALVDGLGHGYGHEITPELRDRMDPFLSRRRLVVPFSKRHPAVRRSSNVRYSPHGRRGLLDIYRHKDEPQQCPVLLQVHGGAWVLGSKEEQAVPLMNHLAALGWVCVAINYRLSPRATWPDHIIDVKRAIVWVKEHIAEYGGNPDFIVITGGSAGGHLASLAALTPNDPEYQPGFEDRDTTVQACVPFYGVYDLTNRDGVGRPDLRDLLERLVMKVPFETHEDLYDRASPMSRVNPEAPPFFVVHGKNDVLVPVAEARLFVERLGAVSTSPVVYAELPGAQHAFEVFSSIRTIHVIQAVERFVAYVYSTFIRETEGQEAPEPVPEEPRAS